MKPRTAHSLRSPSLRSALGLAALILATALPACAGDEGAATASPSSEAAASSPSPGHKTGVAAIDAFIETNPVDKEAPDWKQGLAKPPQVGFDMTKTYYWLLDTNQGSMKIELMPDVAPMHVSSTIYLTRLGFYDDIVFHRVIPGFMAQGGDPTGSGRGGPGYRYGGEFDESARHDQPGILSMANAGPGTDGSQFFLTFKATPHLDGRHTVFGKVVEGKATLGELEKRGSRGRGRPTEPLMIKKASIVVE